MKFQLDFRSGEPIYTQIMEQIQQMLASDELQQGDQLPTVRQLATELRVNFNTVARAYRLLDEAGLISTQQGRGTYILDKPSQETVQRLRQHGLESLTRRYLAEAAHLDYSPQEVAELMVRHIRAWQEQGDQYFEENKDT
ncbi:MAG TPA: GntR family transcriptional regulator [Anaerolineales bacterium]|nr:GntR family transcriptional regulator [Anaerolineales bacterium]